MGRYDEKACCVALNKAFGHEPRVAVTLIDSLGSASEIFELSPKELDQIFGPYSKYRALIKTESILDAEKELQMIESRGCDFIAITDPDYPAMLRDCPDPPVGLYYKGEQKSAEVFGALDSIAVVGTRNVTSYGMDWCERIVGALARTEQRPSIVSGLALGVDVCAHRAALDNGLGTVAVMATGIDAVYPARHIAVAARIAHAPLSALITDYPPGTVPMPVNFLRRNRIIAALSRATILIESRVKGGGMMTCSLANSYGRDVYALPGRADDAASSGCNKLIREKSAEAITDELSLCESLGIRLRGHATKKDRQVDISRRYEGILSVEEIACARQMVETIRKNRDISLEDLCSIMKMPYARVCDMAVMLECDGFIKKDMLGRCSINLKI
ncbi:MAG: DNA-processing protein DprA [Bacteroidales bacterium]|nr:DNA-processing protein DprA [Bacteroidales bacterium]